MKREPSYALGRRHAGALARLAAARAHLAFVERWDDLALLLEIGRHEEAGSPLSLNDLYLLGIASQATVARRIARFKRLGLLVQAPSPGDGRVQLLGLSATAKEAFAAYVRSLR